MENNDSASDITYCNFHRNGTDPADCKLRPDEGLGAIGELSPGNFYTPAATSGILLL
jgi:hypothetical protein